MTNALDFLIAEFDGEADFEPASEAGYVPPLDTDVPISKPLNKKTQKTNQEKIEASANSAELEVILDHVQSGTDLEISERDSQLARNIFAEGRDATDEELQLPAPMIKLRSIMSTYDHEVIADAHKIRNYVTNRLVLASDSQNETISMRALENLGKLSDVGAFTEKREITIKDQSTESLNKILEEKVNRMLGKPIEGEIVG